MMRHCLQSGVLMVALLLPFSAQAQPPIAWWENPVANGLTLSDAQRERINHILGEFRERLTAERQDAERAEREFEDAVNAETVDWPRGRAAIEQLVKARGVFTQDVSLMTLRLRTVLTAEQWKSLQNRRGGREGGREEGRGGKGPRPDGRGRRPIPQGGSQPSTGH